ncbi:hypothetical protein JW898_00005 [Candidatus Woesearchaeota archaeon]|nr:hypothetical protein [Candidatus Woesearchaeota archaeon]
MKGLAYIALMIILVSLVAGCGIMKDTYTIQSRPKAAQAETLAHAEEAEEQEPAQAPTETAPAPKAPAKTATTTAKTTPATTGMSLEEEEAKAIEAAKEFVKSLDGYKNQHGRELSVLSTVKTGENGSWIVEVRFTRDLLYYPDKTEYIKVNVKLKDWKMSSYTFG